MNAIAPLARLGRLAVDLLYPPRCAACGRGGAFLCDDCLVALPRAEGERCESCWRALAGGFCRSCQAQPPGFAGLRSAFRYEGDVRRLVQAFKYGGETVLAEPLAAAMVALLVREGLTADLIVPVPLTGARQRERGFNQAALLAQRIGSALDLPVVEALERWRSAPSQAGSTSAEERRRNVAGAFRLRGKAPVSGQAVLLVDDVATTGATLDVCARVLLDAGAGSVVAATLARED